MIRSFVCNVADVPLPNAEVLRCLPADRLDRVHAAMSKVKAKQIAYAWLLLRYAFRDAGWDVELLNRVRKSASGKPMLKESLWFSLSHSDGTVACAISDEGSVGIDVQHRRTIPEQFWLPYFSPADQAWLKEHPEDFCPAWSKKEALLKCIGTGWTKDSKQSVSVLGNGNLPRFIRGEWISEDCYTAVCCENEQIPAPMMIEAEKIGDVYV